MAQVQPQSVSNPELDSHRNSSRMKLGDHYERWKRFLFDKVSHNKQTFSYTLRSDSCCNTVFNGPTSFVWVTFRDNKVVPIRVELPNFLEGKNMVTTTDFKIAIREATAQYINLVNKFNALFGRQFYYPLE